jgi:thiamine-phosphate pyrophosphorylase
VCSSSAELARRLRLVLITPGDRQPDATQRLVEQALAGGVTAVLLREPQLSQDERNFLAQALTEAAHEAGALLLVHNDTGAALECAADGVHTGWGGPEPAAVRAAAPGLLLGRSAHWPLQDEDRAADYLLLSPFRATPKAHPRPLLSDEQVRRALAEPGLGPIVALGGLTSTEVGALPEGLAGVAVLRAIGQAADPTAAAAELRAAVEHRWPVPA